MTQNPQTPFLPPLLRFSPESFYRDNYIVYFVPLVPRDGSRVTSIEILGDFLDIHPKLTTADISKIEYALNNSTHFLPLETHIPITSPFYKITIRWSDTEDNKTLALVIGREYFRTLRQIASDPGTHARLDKLLQLFDVALSTRASEATLSNILSRLNVALSTRASETTLSNILSQLDTKLSTRASEATLSNILSRLDVPHSTLVKLLRWGRDVTPIWIEGAEIVAPTAGSTLVSLTVSTGKVGYIYGFFISAGEPNDFLINWVSGGTGRRRRIVLGGKGSVQYVDLVALNEGSPADGGTRISITNVNAGSAGVVYQASLLYAEV